MTGAPSRRPQLDAWCSLVLGRQQQVIELERLIDDAQRRGHHHRLEAFMPRLQAATRELEAAKVELLAEETKDLPITAAGHGGRRRAW